MTLEAWCRVTLSAEARTPDETWRSCVSLQAQLTAVLHLMSREAARHICRVFRELHEAVAKENTALKEQVAHLESELRSKVERNRGGDKTVYRIKPSGQFTATNSRPPVIFLSCIVASSRLLRFVSPLDSFRNKPVSSSLASILTFLLLFVSSVSLKIVHQTWGVKVQVRVTIPKSALEWHSFVCWRSGEKSAVCLFQVRLFGRDSGDEALGLRCARRVGEKLKSLRLQQKKSWSSAESVRSRLALQHQLPWWCDGVKTELFVTRKLFRPNKRLSL